VAAAGLRIALISGTFGQGQGTGGQAWLLARGLEERGHRVEVWARRVTSAEGFAGPVHPLPRARRHLWRVIEAVPRRRFDLVHALERVPGADVVRASGGVHAAWLSGAPLSLRRAGRWSLRHRRELALDRAAARRARVVVANSRRVAAEVVAFHGVGPQRVVVVRNGVTPLARPPAHSAALRRRWGVGPRGRVALFLGHDGRRKGLDIAAAAFARVAAPGDRLVAAGPSRGPAGVVCLGPVPAAEALGAADAMLLPSRYDASSNAVLEALAAGVPPVCSGRDGASEVVGDPALVVTSPYDVAGFAEALGYAWTTEDPARWRRAAARWPASRMVRDTEAVYRELADG